MHMVLDSSKQERNLSEEFYKMPSGIRTVKTEDGSEYKYLTDGRIQRYDPVEDAYYPPVDILVYIPDYEWIKKNVPKVLRDRYTFDDDDDYSKNILNHLNNIQDLILVVDQDGEEVRERAEMENAEKLFLKLVERDEYNKVINKLYIPVAKSPVVKFRTFGKSWHIEEEIDLVSTEAHISDEVAEVFEGELTNEEPSTK